MDALLHRGKIKAGDAHRLGVLLPAVFDIHGHIVCKAPLQDLRQSLRMATVGVQLDGKAQFPDPRQEICGPGLEQGLSAGEHHAVQQPAAAFQKGQHLFF